MTVKELIERLQAMDPDLKVYGTDAEYGPYEIESVEDDPEATQTYSTDWVNEKVMALHNGESIEVEIPKALHRTHNHRGVVLSQSNRKTSWMR